MMRKFRFSRSIAANVAKPAKVPVNKENSPANPLLKFAKAEPIPATLANISNTLASYEHCKGNGLSNISKGKGINPQKPHKQKYDDLWQKATALADWIDDSGSTIPWKERTARVPELQGMSMMLQEPNVTGG